MYYVNSGYRRYSNNEGYSDPTAGLALLDESEEPEKPEQPLKFVYEAENGNKLDWDTLVKLWL